MLAPPSLQSEYTLCYSGDPALDLPDAPAIDRNTATPEQIDAADKAIAERDLRLKNARQTGNWPIKQGQKATLFHFKQVGGSATRWWAGESQRQSLSALEDIELMFRLALKSVDGLQGFAIKHDNGKFPMVSVASMDAIYASGCGADGVVELGALVVERALGGVPPLS